LQKWESLSLRKNEKEDRKSRSKKNIMELLNKNIILGITGSISAYKTPLLLRELVKSGANVNVVITESAKKYVTIDLLSNLSKNHVVTEMFDKSLQTDGAWHIHLAHKANLLIIAPCSASTMAKLANGICDNALSLVAMALPKECPILIAPAMDSTMYENPATKRNISLLKSYNYKIIPPESGELSSGLNGIGRLPEIDKLYFEICETLKDSSISTIANSKNEKEIYIDTLQDSVEKVEFDSELELEILKSEQKIKSKIKGKKVLITAGPTIEKIDDVRFISNHSSGKMGYAIAEACEKMGAKTTLISGPVNLKTTNNVELINVVSAKEMYDEVQKIKNSFDIFIMAAAVSDYTIEKKYDGKIKKKSESMSIDLVRTKDILKSVGESKTENQTVIGFALESKNEIEYGRKKLVDKNCDMIVVNSANKKDSGFGGDKNKITILKKSGQSTSFPIMTKKECALKILENI